MTLYHRQKIEDEFKKVTAFLQNHFQINKAPRLIYRQTGSIAGFFSRGDNTMSLNPAYFERNFEDMLNQTLPHELAHAFTHYHFREKMQQRNVAAHGTEWKSVMNVLGVPAISCHNYDTSQAYGPKIEKVKIEPPKEFAQFTIPDLEINAENW